MASIFADLSDAISGNGPANGVILRSAILPDIALGGAGGDSQGGGGALGAILRRVKPEVIAGPFDAAPYGKNEQSGLYFPLVLAGAALLAGLLIVGVLAVVRGR